MNNTPADGMPPVHPGEIIREDILDELGMSVNALAIALRVTQSRMADIVAGRRGITADTALRLARYLGSTPEFWLRLQANYDLKLARQTSGDDIARQVTPRQAKIPAG